MNKLFVGRVETVATTAAQEDAPFFSFPIHVLQRQLGPLYQIALALHERIGKLAAFRQRTKSLPPSSGHSGAALRLVVDSEDALKLVIHSVRWAWRTHHSTYGDRAGGVQQRRTAPYGFDLAGLAGESDICVEVYWCIDGNGTRWSERWAEVAVENSQDELAPLVFANEYHNIPQEHLVSSGPPRRLSEGSLASSTTIHLS